MNIVKKIKSFVLLKKIYEEMGGEANTNLRYTLYINIHYLVTIQNKG